MVVIWTMMYTLNYISTWPDFTRIQIEKGLVSAPYDVLQMSPSALLMLKIWETFWDFCEAIECKLKPGIVSHQKQLRRLQKLTEQLTKQSPHKVHSVAVLELLDGSDLPRQTVASLSWTCRVFSEHVKDIRSTLARKLKLKNRCSPWKKQFTT